MKKLQGVQVSEVKSKKSNLTYGAFLSMLGSGGLGMTLYLLWL